MRKLLLCTALLLATSPASAGFIVGPGDPLILREVVKRGTFIP